MSKCVKNKEFLARREGLRNVSLIFLKHVVLILCKHTRGKYGVFLWGEGLGETWRKGVRSKLKEKWVFGIYIYAKMR